MPKIQADASPGQSPTLPFCLLPRSLDFTNKCSVYLGPATSLQGILWGPIRNVNFLKGGGGSSWGGLLTPGSPRLGKQPTVQGQTLGFSDPGPLLSKAPSCGSLSGREVKGTQALPYLGKAYHKAVTPVEPTPVSVGSSLALS